jgi:hypothetical protein
MPSDGPFVFAPLTDHPVVHGRSFDLATVDGPAPTERSGCPERPSLVDRWATPTSLSWAVVACVVAWNLWTLRASLHAVAYLDDASLHEQMVRFAAHAFENGHNPLTGWFPYLGAGSPQFLHYQSLGAMLTGLAGVFVGPDSAFRWSLYLLVAAWPVSVYLAARLMRIGLVAATAAAVLSSYLMSVPGVGYEPKAYLWIGYGVWAQLWASWTLPLAWAFTWRALEDWRFVAPAAAAVAATACFHFETGYLALAAIFVLPLVSPSQLKTRVPRAAVTLVAALAAAAWALVPLVVFGKWAAVNQVLGGTPLENGYGARQVLTWLVSGRIYDAGRFPVITILAAVGIATCIARWRRWALGRGLVALWTVSLVLSFGRTTFGPLARIVPGSADLFFRRFMMGAQLTGIILAGVGAAAAVDLVVTLLKRTSARAAARTSTGASGQSIGAPRRWAAISAAAMGAVVVLAITAFLPALVQSYRYDLRNAATIGMQSRAEDLESSNLLPLVSYVKRHGGGRTYAGLPTNWGATFTIGMVPVFKYLESQDVDEIGYTLRTASLMTDPEYHFDESDPSDYALFGVRYLILPTGSHPPVTARAVESRGPYSLWVVPSGGYVDAVTIVGTISADRSDVATRTLTVLRSTLAARHEELAVDFAGAGGAVASAVLTGRASGPVATAVSQPHDLASGRATTLVHLSRPAVVTLAASMDPGWHVTVDGRPVPTMMLAPAIVGVDVPPGAHRVVFQYEGFPYFVELALSGVALLALVAVVTFRRCGAGSRRRRTGVSREAWPTNGQAASSTELPAR